MADCSATAYIHMVQHLIEKCLIFQMSEVQCMEALSKHANINPVITRTVWKELEKENKQFFAAYKMREFKLLSEAESTEKLLQILSASSQIADKPSNL